MRFKVSINKKDAAATALLCLVGMAAALQVSAHSVARASGLGAGVLPVVLGALLMLAGVLYVFNSRLSPDEDDDVDIGPSKWRASCGPASATFSLLLLARYGGLLPAVFAFVFLFTLGDCRHTVRSASLLAGGAVMAVGLALFLFPVPSLPMFRWN